MNMHSRARISTFQHITDPRPGRAHDSNMCLETDLEAGTATVITGRSSDMQTPVRTESRSHGVTANTCYAFTLCVFHLEASACGMCEPACCSSSRATRSTARVLGSSLIWQPHFLASLTISPSGHTHAPCSPYTRALSAQVSPASPCFSCQPMCLLRL